MKTHRHITSIFFIIVLCLFIFSCSSSDPHNDDNSSPPDSSLGRKALLEIVTGYQCGYCPPADIEAERLLSIYDSNLIVIAIHAGSFAIPSVPAYDFRCDAGIAWYNLFGFPGTPFGMVNRRGFAANNHILSYDLWQKNINDIMYLTPKIDLSVSAILDSQSNKISVSVYYKYLESALTEFHNINVVIAEDKIIKYQKWYKHNPEDVPDYEHNHVLRDAVNGTWGDKLNQSEDNLNFEYEIPSYKDWNVENLKIIAFISDIGNTYEIYQAAQTNLVVK